MLDAVAQQVDRLTRGGSPTLASPLAPRLAVAFLGDNLYTSGLGPDDGIGRSVLLAQLRSAAPASAVFVQGNHDWANSGRRGWDRVRRAHELLEANGARLLSPPGCPGPEAFQFGRIRVIGLDTQWYLHAHEKPGTEEGCRVSTREQLVDQLDGLLSEDPAYSVVIGHHPLRSSGEHGGGYDWEAHLFPLRGLHEWLWLPLPGLGSLYVWARVGGVSRQDLGNRHYRELIAQIETVLERHQPMLYAGGHEHILELTPAGTLPALLTSGSAGKLSPVRERNDDTGFAVSRRGFARLDVETSGRAMLRLFAVEESGEIVPLRADCLRGCP